MRYEIEKGLGACNTRVQSSTDICRTPWKLFVKHYDGASTECTLFLFFIRGMFVGLFVCHIIVCLFVAMFERKVHYVGVTY